MFIDMTIKNIKSIKELYFKIPLTPGLYAITGENGSGKSTLVASAAGSFMNLPLVSHFGKAYPDARLDYKRADMSRVYELRDGRWKPNAKGTLKINGFFEGSITFGKRFADVDFGKLVLARNIKKDDLQPATDFIKYHLGDILRKNSAYYDSLFILSESAKQRYQLRKSWYYYEVGGTLVNQLLMSTGENLLLSVLHSLEFNVNEYKKRKYDQPTLIILDEVEFALHSSSLRRLVYLLRKLSNEYNFTVIFSTHSPELLRDIEPNNIYYMQKLVDGQISITNPCYPVFATKNLESSRSGYDFVIFVEDVLAEKMITELLKKNRLLGGKSVKVIPVGGYSQVIRFAYDAIQSNLMMTATKILIILDQDIESNAKKFMKNEKIGFSNEPMYLPVQSIEKYLLTNLVNTVDIGLHQELESYVFQGTPLKDLILSFTSKKESSDPIESGGGNKSFYSLLQQELRQLKKDDTFLVDTLVEYLIRNNDENTMKLSESLKAILDSPNKV